MDKIKSIAPIIEPIIFGLLFSGVLHFSSAFLKDRACFSIFILATVLSLPIYLFKKELSLIKNKALVDQFFKNSSTFNQLLSRQTFRKFRYAIYSWLLSLLLIYTTINFEFEHWLIIYLDVIILTILHQYTKKKLQNDVNIDHIGLVSINFPLKWINSAILVTSLVLVDYFIIGSTNTAFKSVEKIIEDIFNANTDSACFINSYLITAFESLDAIGWHYMQVGSMQAESEDFKIIAWVIFLISSAISALIIQNIFLGSIRAAELKEEKGLSVLGKTLFSKTLMITIFILAFIYFFIVYKFNSVDFSALKAPLALSLDQIDPCKKIKDPSVISDHNEEIYKRIDERAVQIERIVLQKIDNTFERLEEKKKIGINNYLNWIYSVIGEYERLATVFTGDVANKMRQKISDKIFTETGLSNDIDNAVSNSHTEINKQVNALTEEVFGQSFDFKSSNPCLMQEIHLPSPSLAKEQIHVGSSAMAALLAGRITTKSLGQHAAALTATKIVNKSAFKAAIKLISTTLAKKGASAATGAAGGALAGLACGPAAPACSIVGGVVGGLVTWVAFDKIVVEIDEHLNRAALEQQITQTLDQQLNESKELIKEVAKNRIKVLTLDLKKYHNSIFIPHRDA